MLASIYTYALLLLVLLATALPLFTEEWLERRATDSAPSRGYALDQASQIGIPGAVMALSHQFRDEFVDDVYHHQ